MKGSLPRPSSTAPATAGRMLRHGAIADAYDLVLAPHRDRELLPKIGSRGASSNLSAAPAASQFLASTFSMVRSRAVEDQLPVFGILPVEQQVRRAAQHLELEIDAQVQSEIADPDLSGSSRMLVARRCGGRRQCGCSSAAGRRAAARQCAWITPVREARIAVYRGAGGNPRPVARMDPRRCRPRGCGNRSGRSPRLHHRVAARPRRFLRIDSARYCRTRCRPRTAAPGAQHLEGWKSYSGFSGAAFTSENSAPATVHPPSARDTSRTAPPVCR